MKLLVILSRDPAGRASGRRTVIASTIEALTGLGHQVRVVALARAASASAAWPPGVQFDVVSSAGPLDVVKNVLGGALLGRLSLNECLYVSGRARRQVARIAADWQPQVVVVDMIRSYEVARATGRPLIVDLDDLLSERYANAGSSGMESETILGYYQEGLPRPVRRLAGSVAVRLLRLESRLLRRRERMVVRDAAATVVVSRDEAALLSSATTRPVVAIPMAVSAKGRHPGDPRPEQPSEDWSNAEVLFVGGLDYQANRQAMDWYVGAVAPQLRQMGRADIRLHVIGFCPPDLQRHYSDAGLVIHGYVEDLAGVLRRRPVFVAPIRSGTGVKTKVVEAMAYGCPVVTTTIGAKGLGAVDGEHCRIADTPASFASAVMQLVDDQVLAGQIGERSLGLATERFSSEVVAEQWQGVLQRVAEGLSAGPRLQVLFLNDYPMLEALAEWRRGEYPGQHLFGVTHLAELGVDVAILPFGRFSSLRSWLSKRIGDLGQQLRVLTWGRPYDVLYSGSQYDTVLLSVLRTLGLFRRPLVATMHHLAKGPLRRPWLFRALYRGHDLVLCMSDDIERELIDDLGFPASKVLQVGWAVDLDFYQMGPEPDRDPPLILAAGKTKRDYRTLVDAVDGLACQVEVYCSANSAPAGPYAPNVSVIFDRENDANQASALTMDELLEKYRASSIVAIPLPESEVRGTTGLTSLLEAMAMGRAVMMTTNTSIDIEAEGCGIFVAPGDTAAWHRAIDQVVSDGDLAARLGRRGRQVCEERFVLEDYAKRIAAALQAVATDR